MGLFQIIRSSVYDPAFYAGMRDRSWTEAAKYYAVIAFVIVFALLAPVWVLLVNARPEHIDTIAAVFPDALEVTLVDGEMHINQAEPFAIPNTFTKELPGNFAVFTTQDDIYTPSALDEADTMVLFKNTFAVVEPGGRNEQRVFSYGTSTGTTTITKADITAIAEKIKPYVRPVAIIGGAFFFVLAVLLGGIGMLIFHLMYALIPGLFVYVYFKMRKRTDTFNTAYTTALFASIPVTLVFAILGLFFVFPPFSYTFIVLLIVIMNDTRKAVRTD